MSVTPMREPATPNPNRSPTRAALAQAIEGHQAALSRLNAAKAAGPRSLTARIAARAAVDQAKQALAKAEEAAPERRLDALLGRPVESNPSGLSLAAAEATLAEAEAALGQAINDSELLQAEVAQAEAAHEWARDQLSAAVGAVLADSDALGQLLDAFDNARARVAELDAALIEAWRAGAFPGRSTAPHQIINRPLPPAPEPVATAWREAIAALADDPDAPLPGDPGAA